MLPHLRSLTTLLLGVLFSCTYLSCKQAGDIEMTPDFSTEIEVQQNIAFNFSKDLCPDSLLNNWDSTEYLQLTPSVQGLFRWTGSHTLVFSPASGFEPGTEYKAVATGKVSRYKKGKGYSVSSKPVTFRTAPLRVEQATASWARATGQQDVVVQLDLMLNYEVNLAEAARRIRLQYEGKNVSVRQSATGRSRSMSLQFTGVTDDGANEFLSVEVLQGISVPGTHYTSVQDTSFTVSIPSRYNLAITSVYAQHSGTEGIITISTSQPVLEATLKKAISISPHASFDVTANEGGFTISGNGFDPAQLYDLTIAPGLEGTLGGKLKNTYSTSVSFGRLRPTISFSNTKGMYLTGNGYKNISLSLINVPNVEVSVVKVFANNLEQFLRRDKYWDYHYDDEAEEGNSYRFYDTEYIGDTVFSRTYETNKLPRQNAAHILNLDFKDRLKDYNGVYVLQVKSKDHYWIQESKIISISDIGLIVKQSKDAVYVFANSLKSATAISGVTIGLVSDHNQKMGTATTNDEGVAIFRDINTTTPGFSPGLVTAEKSGDFNFVSLNDTRIGTSRFDVGGRIPNTTNLITMIHAERNLYRPGETMHMEAIVRNEQWHVQAAMPVKVKLLMPNGKEFAAVRRMLNEQGSCDVSFSPPHTAMTGTWIAQVYTGNDVLLTSANISVEEFMPDRLKVAVKTERGEYRPGEKIVTSIQADNLYGTPAAGRNYECVLKLSKGTFSSDKYPEYNFAITGDLNSEEVMRDGKTDDKGAASEVFEPGTSIGDVGIINGNVTATVFDETGRPLHRYAHFAIYTQSLFAGIRCRERYVSSRTPVQLGLICMDKGGNLKTGEAEVVVVHKEWHTVIQRSGNSYRYVSQSDDRVISRKTVTISGAGTHYTFSAPQSGQYEVRVCMKGTKGYVAQTLYAWGWGDTQYSSFEVNNEGNVEIKTDKKQYNSGDRVNVLFSTPFEGRMLVTLERDDVIKHYYLQTKDKAASISFDAGNDMLPNVYVTATLFRPMDGSDMPLTVAHGFKPVPVTDVKAQLPVAITVAEQSRSKTKQRIKVKTAPGASVVIAAVDEGILQIKSFATPDPYGYFYQKTALTVNSYDLYPWLLPEIKTTLSSTGGDGAGYDGSRVNPLFVNRVKNVSFWSGILQADGSGNVSYDIDIPQFSGDIRVMAVAYKDNAFGSSDKHIKVADPIVTSVALPRFLSPGDEVTMAVSLSNTTRTPAKATVTIATTGQVQVADATREIEVPAGREQQLIYNITAQPASGTAKVTVSVKALNETFVNETELSVRPAASLQKITGNGFVAAGKKQPVSFTNNFIPVSFNGHITVGKSPVTRFAKHLDDLVRYPYGCVEQTTSAVFPQLYYADMAKSVSGRDNTDMNPANNIQQAINKLQSMQLSNGALSYWPGGGYESWWGSIYACHFLLEARKAGFEVNQRTISRLTDYLKTRLYKKELTSFWYNNHQRKDVAPEEVPYSLYVLAIADQPQLADMNYYKAHRDLLTLDGKYLLAATYRMAGMPVQAAEVQPPAFAGEDPDRSLGGSFSSYLRDLALALNVLMDTDPHNKQVGTLSKQLADKLTSAQYVNTQEKAFSLLALGKVARLANKTNGTATITNGGRTIGHTDGSTVTARIPADAQNNLSIAAAGSGGFYYSWEVSGISTDGSYKEEDSHMRVRRSYMDRNGHPLTTTFRQNDLIIVHISVEAQHDMRIENVAITDMLPAGFEVENTRLSALPEADWIKKRSTPDYMDIRDDRVNMFTTVTGKVQDFYYMVRAVSPGTYKLGPVQADAMYDGSYHSYNGACTIRITQ